MDLFDFTISPLTPFYFDVLFFLFLAPEGGDHTLHGTANPYLTQPNLNHYLK